MTAIAVYRGAREPVPAREEDLSWDEICHELEAATSEITATDKRDLVAVSPVKLRAPYRKTENVEHVTALFVDFDSCDLGVIERRIQELGIAAIVYGSPSDAPDARRVRVVAPVTRPIAPAECRATRLAFAEELGHGPGCGVDGASDPAKLFFVGHLEGTPTRYFRRFDGVPVNVDALDPPRLAWGAPLPAPAIADLLADLPPASEGIARALGPWTAHQGRKWLVCGALGGTMRKMGLSAAQCEAEVRAWLPENEPTVDVNAGVTWALGAWAREPADVSGHAELARILGDAHAEHVEQAVYAATPWARASARVQAVTPHNPFVPVVASDGDPLALLGTDPGFDDACRPMDWLIPHFQIGPGKYSLFTAYANGSKTPTAALLSLCVASGTPFWGREIKRVVPVLYLAFESGRNVRRKMLRIGKAIGVDVRKLVADGMLRVIDAKAFTPKIVAAVKLAITTYGIGLVVADTVTSALRNSPVGRNDEAYARPLFDLGEISEETRCTILGCAHDNKSATGSEIRGTAGTEALIGAAQTVIRLEPNSGAKSQITVSCVRVSDGTAFDPLTIRWVDGDGSAAAAIAAVENGIEVPLHCEVEGSFVTDGRGGNLRGRNSAREMEAFAKKARAIPRVLDTIRKTPKGGVCTIRNLEAEAGEISLKGLREVMSRLVEVGVIFRDDYGSHELTEKAKAMSRDALDGRALELVTGETVRLRNEVLS